MSTQKIYALPVETTGWKFDGATEISFNWEYDDGSADLLNLYEKGKQQQWDASTRLDWKLELNPDNPMELKDEAISIYDTDYWRKMTDKEKSWLRRELQAHMKRLTSINCYRATGNESFTSESKWQSSSAVISDFHIKFSQCRNDLLHRADSGVRVTIKSNINPS